MKLAILANDRPSFIKPLSLGLQKMLSRINVECDIFYNGLDLLDSVKPETSFSINDQLRAKAFSYFKNKQPNSFLKLVERLKEYDCIVVCLNVPAAYMHERFRGIEMLRKYLKVPIVNYDLHTIFGLGPFTSYLIEPEGKAPGLERFDYNLLVTDTTYHGLPDLDYNYSVIGLDMRDNILDTEHKKGIVFLVDFERPGYEDESKVIMEALKKTNSEYTQLKGVYSMEEIRKLSRGFAGYFLAFPEAFGLPIVELQLCGCYIFTAHNLWPLSHFHKNKFEKGEGKLGRNFIVYDNSVDKLCAEIEKLKKDYNPMQVLHQFEQDYPDYYSGNETELKKFIEKLKSGEINHLSHLKNKKLNQPVYEFYLRNK